MPLTLARAEGTMSDLPPTAFSISDTDPRELPQIADAYRAGAEIRSDHEFYNWWGTDHLRAAQAFYEQGTLKVQRVHIPSPSRSPIHNPYSTRYSRVTATAVIQKDSPRDEELWRDIADISESIHVHRLATHPQFYGQRHGEAMMASIAFAFNGGTYTRPYLRLDCAAEATALRSYYEERIGLLCVGEVTRDASDYRAALYQGELSQLVPTSWPTRRNCDQ